MSWQDWIGRLVSSPGSVTEWLEWVTSLPLGISFPICTIHFMNPSDFISHQDQPGNWAHSLQTTKQVSEVQTLFSVRKLANVHMFTFQKGNWGRVQSSLKVSGCNHPKVCFQSHAFKAVRPWEDRVQSASLGDGGKDGESEKDGWGNGTGDEGGGREESVLFCGVHFRGVGVPYTEVSPITCLVLRESLQFLF